MYSISKLGPYGRKVSCQLLRDSQKTFGGTEISVFDWTVFQTFLPLQACRIEDIQICDDSASYLCKISLATMQFPTGSTVQVWICPFYRWGIQCLEGWIDLISILLTGAWQSQESNPHFGIQHHSFPDTHKTWFL